MSRACSCLLAPASELRRSEQLCAASGGPSPCTRHRRRHFAARPGGIQMQMRSSTLVVSAIAIMLAGSISGCTQDDGDATTSSEHAEEACAEQLDTSPDTPVFGLDWGQTANCYANVAALCAP